MSSKAATILQQQASHTQSLFIFLEKKTQKRKKSCFFYVFDLNHFLFFSLNEVSVLVPKHVKSSSDGNKMIPQETKHVFFACFSPTPLAAAASPYLPPLPPPPPPPHCLALPHFGGFYVGV